METRGRRRRRRRQRQKRCEGRTLRINIHSCSTSFERPAYPRIDQIQDPPFPRPSPTYHELEIRNASYAGALLFSSSARSPSPPSLRHLRLHQLSTPRTAHSRPFRFGPAIWTPILVRVSNGYSEKLFQIEG